MWVREKKQRCEEGLGELLHVLMFNSASLIVLIGEKHEFTNEIHRQVAKKQNKKNNMIIFPRPSCPRAGIIHFRKAFWKKLSFQV